MPTGEQLPEGWKGAFLVAWGMGLSIEAAAEKAGVGTSTVYAHRTKDLEFAAEWREAKDMRRHLRSERAWDANDRLVLNPAHRDHHAAVKLAIEKNDPDGAQRIDIDVSGTVAIEDRSSSLHDVALVLAAVGALPQHRGGAPRYELPAADEVLAEPPPR